AKAANGAGGAPAEACNGVGVPASSVKSVIGLSARGPVMLGAERTVPHTIAIGNGGLGIAATTDQGEIRSLEAMEADMIRLALGRYRWHMTEVARRLGIGRSTLYRKMREYGLEGRLN